MQIQKNSTKEKLLQMNVIRNVLMNCTKKALRIICVQQEVLKMLRPHDCEHCHFKVPQYDYVREVGGDTDLQKFNGRDIEYCTFQKCGRGKTPDTNHYLNHIFPNELCLFIRIVAVISHQHYFGQEKNISSSILCKDLLKNERGRDPKFYSRASKRGKVSRGSQPLSELDKATYASS
ncbi:hypothetical protein AVEN_179043-1 [Araneus ventricosus]|uniref:Uncharacterized protein n=1 Tax=Araneus ventricosus TaxID=182803 RepID=A0A4Y2JBD1_ARAVE|nr:hypothetical protein AVEN_179043-1 [Araneus ventricosus]